MYKDTENIDKGRRSLAGAGRRMSPGLGEGDKAAVMSSSEAPASQRRRAGGLSVCVCSSGRFRAHAICIAIIIIILLQLPVQGYVCFCVKPDFLFF